MRNVAIFLCILLVAYSTQGSVWSEIANEITSTVEFFTEKAVVKEKMMVDYMENYAMVDYRINVDNCVSIIKNYINEWDQYEAEWRAEHGNISSCMSWGIAWKKNSLDLVSNSIGCANRELDKLATTYETALTSLEEFRSDLADIAGRTESCVSKNHTATSCLIKIWKSLGRKYTDGWTTLLIDVTTLVIDFSNFREEVERCGYKSGLELTISSELKTAVAVTERCITNLNSISL